MTDYSVIVKPYRCSYVGALPASKGIIMTETYFVTGSSVGLGRSIVEAALAQGHNVVATARNPAVLEDLAARYSGQLLAVRLDVTDAEGARDAVRQAVDKFGRLDVLINNAGFSGVGSIEDMPLELIEAQLSTNFLGAVNLTRAVLPTMRARARGRILLVSSIGARIATAGAGVYYASKAAVSALAETLALEVGSLGIQVTAVEPGAMRTRFAEAGSLQVSPFGPAYEATVGTTIGMMQSPEYNNILRDPDGVAAMILQVAALDDPPSRILAGADSFEMGIGSGDARRASDLHWEKLSRSATVEERLLSA
ncbi:SDR family oxidoreductase [Sphingopyxis sp.]|uniref:SDR family oxidoreductase n=2 Tax=Sphingopyxis sp. TaxID=1908224 RepID=UPI0040371C45